MLNTRSEKKKHGILFILRNSMTLNMCISMSYTGLTPQTGEYTALLDYGYETAL